MAVFQKLLRETRPRFDISLCSCCTSSRGEYRAVFVLLSLGCFEVRTKRCIGVNTEIRKCFTDSFHCHHHEAPLKSDEFLNWGSV